MREKFHEKCNFIDIDLPQLVLGVTSEYTMKDEESWRYIQHQYGGMLCRQLYIKARILKPLDKYWDPIHRLEKKFVDYFGNCHTLNSIIEYREYINSNLNVDCNYDFWDFDEALYPIDCTKENVEILTGEIIKNFDDAIEFETEMDRLVGCIGRWKLYILGFNSD
ncbi:MAG: hypothetical protein INQ03_24150 [Candidatus Heimdallarchaeota archaeon]|nr:hypothetical protein [Candidatus Heimdallarchaeota archaeon]